MIEDWELSLPGFSLCEQTIYYYALLPVWNNGKPEENPLGHFPEWVIKHCSDKCFIDV